MDCVKSPVHVRRLAGLGVIIALLATTFAPAMAASQGPPADSPSFSTRSITKIVANSAPDSRLHTDKAAPEAPKKAQATKSGSFFKTRTGLLVAAVMAAGTGYALYSAKEDRIRGSIR
jgi:hypothetical protein